MKFMPFAVSPWMWVSVGVFGGGVVQTWREAPHRLFGSREVALIGDIIVVSARK